MCLMICGNVSSLFLPHSNEKEVAAANRFHSTRFLPGFSTNAGADANGSCFPPAMAQKALSTNTSNAGTKSVSWWRFFVCFLRNMGASRRRCPMAGYGRHVAASPDALSKNQRLRASDATRRTGAEAAARYISMWMVRAFLWE